MRDGLRTYILGNFMFGAKADDLDDDASFLETGILDSTSVLELISHLEQQYGIVVSDTELVPENLDSISRLCAYLARKGAAVAQ